MEGDEFTENENVSSGLYQRGLSGLPFEIGRQKQIVENAVLPSQRRLSLSLCRQGI